MNIIKEDQVFSLSHTTLLPEVNLLLPEISLKIVFNIYAFAPARASIFLSQPSARVSSGRSFSDLGQNSRQPLSDPEQTSFFELLRF